MRRRTDTERLEKLLDLFAVVRVVMKPEGPHLGVISIDMRPGERLAVSRAAIDALLDREDAARVDDGIES